MVSCGMTSAVIVVVGWVASFEVATGLALVFFDTVVVVVASG